MKYRKWIRPSHILSCTLTVQVCRSAYYNCDVVHDQRCELKCGKNATTSLPFNDKNKTKQNKIEKKNDYNLQIWLIGCHCAWLQYTVRRMTYYVVNNIIYRHAQPHTLLLLLLSSSVIAPIQSDSSDQF